VITGVSKIVINIEDLDANDRAVGSVAITGSACRYNGVAVDGPGRYCAAYVPGAHHGSKPPSELASSTMTRRPPPDRRSGRHRGDTGRRRPW
jgi:hypothetical protein